MENGKFWCKSAFADLIRTACGHSSLQNARHFALLILHSPFFYGVLSATVQVKVSVSE